jgi:8-oxo-dGTP diphosphatase
MSADEKAFLDAYDPEAFPRPSVTVDLVLLSVHDRALHALVMRRDQHPGKGKLALPGGFVGIDESLDDAARRLLDERARMKDAYVEQLYTFGAVARDPRMRIISVAYFALLPVERFECAVQSSPELTIAEMVVPWEGEAGGPVDICSPDGDVMPLAFDHADILGVAVKRLRGKIDYSGIAFELLPEEFTLRQLQEIHEGILGTRFNKPAFRRRILDKRILVPTGRREEGVTFRPAELYRYAGRETA